MVNAKSTKEKSQEEIEEEIDVWHQSSDFTKALKKSAGKVFDPKTRTMTGRPRVGRKFNVTFPELTIEKLKEAASKRGVGYQTMVRIIVSEKLKEYE
jgi:predicted DNA binding CopG/RHH family protein